MTDAVREKVHLIWCHRTQCPLLSLNILREVAHYLTYSVRLLGVTDNRLSLYVVPGNYVKTLTLSVSFTDGTRNCWLSDSTALFVGGGSYLTPQPVVADTFLLDTHDFSVTQQVCMSEARFAPGLISVEDEALVFGGYNRGALLTCEKFNKGMNWESLPSMNHPRYAFSPVHYRDKVYLSYIATANEAMEVFVPAENRFETVFVGLTKSSHCCLAVMYEDHLLVLSCNHFEWYWNPTTNASGRSEIGPQRTRLSSCPAAVVQDTLYWVEFRTGELVSFDLTDIKKTWKK